MTLRVATLLIAFLSGCGARAAPTETVTSADAIDLIDDPGGLLGHYSNRLADQISPTDVGMTFSASTVPYPDSYWPFTSGGIDVRWNADDLSPLEKMIGLVSPSSLADAKAWERVNHGQDVPNVGSWYGHCPGWTAAAIETPLLAHGITVRKGPSGFESCQSSSEGCTTFEIGDLDGLLAEVFLDGPARLIGARCDVALANIQRDANGRIVRDGTGCKGVNAAALVIVLGERIKHAHAAVAIDAQNDANTDQIWNQPAYAYTVNRIQALDSLEAANLVAHGTRTGGETTYSWNANARGFAFVDLSIAWVSEAGPNVTPLSGTLRTRTMRVVAVLELDRNMSDPAAILLGGEYIDDPSVGADRLTVPPFLWLPGGMGPEELQTSGESSHNPYISPAIVRELVKLAGT